MGQDLSARGVNRNAVDMIRLFWAAKIYALIIFIVLAVCSTIWLKAQSKYYRAQMFVGPVEAMFAASDEPLYEAQDVYAGTPLYKMQRRDTNLAFQQGLKYMRGEAMAQKLAADMPQLYNYFAAEGDLVFPWQRRYDLNVLDQDQAADIASLIYILKARVSIQPDGLTPFYRISFESRDPALALQFMRGLYAYADYGLRQDARGEVNARLDYLRGRLEQSRSGNDRKTLAALITQEENTLMMTEAGGAFALRLVEAPSVMPAPIWPRPFLIYAAVLLVSLLLGTALYSLRGSDESVGHG